MSKEVGYKGIDNSYPIQVSYYFVEEQFRLLSGKILTFIDMAVTDKQANKAWKDLVKQEFYKRLSEAQSECSEGKSGHRVQLEPQSSDRLV